MKTKTLVVALALTLMPAISFAEGCNYSKQQQAMSCAAGSVYDEDSKTCVVINA